MTIEDNVGAGINVLNWILAKVTAIIEWAVGFITIPFILVVALLLFLVWAFFNQEKLGF